MSFLDKIRQFMYGRYGMDDLEKFLIGLYAALIILKVFLPGKIIYALSIVVVILFAVRFLSKDINARQRENNKYLDIKNRFFCWYDAKRDEYRSRKTHVFRVCPNCKAKIKLPRKKGKHICNCPRCGKDFNVNVL